MRVIILYIIISINLYSAIDNIKLKIVIEKEKRDTLLIHKQLDIVNSKGKETHSNLKSIKLIGGGFKRCKNKSKLLKITIDRFPLDSNLTYKRLKILNEKELKDIRLYSIENRIYIYIERCHEMILPTINMEAEY